MRTVSTVCKICMWFFFVLSLCFHALAIVGLSSNNQLATEAGKTGDVFDLTPMLIGCGLMLLSVLFFTVLPRGKWIPLIAAVIAGALLLVVTIRLGDIFEPQIGIDGSDVGLTPWRLVYRHYSMLLVPLLMAVAFFTGRSADKAVEAQFEQSYRSQYVFDGAPLFRDDDTAGGEKKKRSVLIRERKMADAFRRKQEREERERAAAAIPLNKEENTPPTE